MSSINPVVSEEKMFENVEGRRTDDGVTGILLLTNEPSAQVS